MTPFLIFVLVLIVNAAGAGLAMGLGERRGWSSRGEAETIFVAVLWPVTLLAILAAYVADRVSGRKAQ